MILKQARTRREPCPKHLHAPTTALAALPGSASGAGRSPSYGEGSVIGGSTLTPSPCCPPLSPLPSPYLFRPDLDPLPLLPLGSAPGSWGLSLLLVLLVILDLLVQVLHQLLDSRVGGRGTDFLAPFGGKPGGAGRKVCSGVGRRRTWRGRVWLKPNCSGWSQPQWGTYTTARSKHPDSGPWRL